MPVSTLKLIATGDRLRSAIEILRFFKGGDGRDKPTLNDGNSFLRQSWPENDERMPDFATQNRGLFQIRDPEKLRLLGEGLGHAHHAVSVGVRLHDGEKFHPGPSFSRTTAALYRNAL